MKIPRRGFNDYKELIANALTGDRSAQKTLKLEVTSSRIKVKDLRPELVRSAMGLAIGKMRAQSASSRKA
jgi:hypothetical protein